VALVLQNWRTLQGQPVTWWRCAYRYRAYLLLSLISLVGLALRSYGINDRDLWTDEAAKIAFAKLPAPAFWQVMFGGHEENPPLYFLLLGGIIQLLGDSLWAYRLISLLSGIITIIAAYYLASCLVNRKFGVIAAGLVAVSPYFISLSQESNNYSLLGAACTLSLWRFWVAIKTGKRSDWILYACVTAIAVYTHYYAVLVVALQAVYLVSTCVLLRRRLPDNWQFGVLALVLLHLPLLPLGVRQMQAADADGFIGRSPVGYLATVVTNTLNLGSGYRLNEFRAVLPIQPSLASGAQLAEFLLIALAPLSMALFGSVRFVRRTGLAGSYAVLVFFGASLLGAYTLFLARHISIVATLYFMLLAAAIYFSSTRRAAGLLGLILLVDVVSLSHFYASPWSRNRPQAWAVVTEQVLAGVKSGDVVVVDAWIGGAFAFEYQAWALQPERVRPADGERQRFLGPAPLSWQVMEPRPLLMKIAYTWQVYGDGRLTERTVPDYLSPELEAAGIRDIVCASCTLWVLYDAWDASGWPIKLASLSDSMAPILIEDASPSLRLMALKVKDPQRAPGQETDPPS
jgi:4-amino-4-deoxy-L-arabinose transferase-like glycosyltransferase